MTSDKLRVAVLGAGKWAEFAHIPGWTRDPRAEVVVLADVEAERAEALAHGFAIPETTTDWQAAISRSDVDVVDIVTPSHTIKSSRGRHSTRANTFYAKSPWPTIFVKRWKPLSSRKKRT